MCCNGDRANAEVTDVAELKVVAAEFPVNSEDNCDADVELTVEDEVDEASIGG